MNSSYVILVIIAMLIVLSFVAGCGEPFAAGFAGGVATMKTLAEQSQKQFNESMSELNAEKEKIDELIKQVEDDDIKSYLQSIVDEETAANIEDLKETDWKDPKVAIPTGIALLSTLTAAYQKRKRVIESGA